MWAVNPDGINPAAREAFWSLNGPALPSRVNIPPQARFLWLDPSTTSPNVILGVAIPGSPRTFMKPGDVLPVPKNAGALAVWNPWKRLLVLSADHYAILVGFLGLRAVTAEELPALVALKGRRTPNPPGNVICAGNVDLVQRFIPTSNLTGLRITAIPMNPGGTALTTHPADFALTIRPGALFIGQGPGALASPAFAERLDLVTIDGNDVVAANTFGAFQSNNDLVASQYQATFDMVVPAGSPFMLLQPSGLAGTGIHSTRFGLIVEGA